MTKATQQKLGRSWLSMMLNALCCLAVLAGAAAGVWWIYHTEPVAEQIETKRKSAALVETITVMRSTYEPELVVLGTVQAAQEVTVSPRVRGQVVEISPDYIPGGMVKKGDVLLEIDPADFENEVEVRKSQLEQVQADWEIELGRGKLAEQELELLGDSISGINRSLVLRQPQSASLKSRLRAAEAAVERAKLDLERTKLVAPFDAQVLQRTANIGSQVQPGDDLGQLVGIGQYWVIAAVPVRNLRWVQFPDEEHAGSAVSLRNSDAWGPNAKRNGVVARMIGALDQQTRLARVLVTIDDPLGMQSGGMESEVPPLILDTLVEAKIKGKVIADVVRIKREYVHEGDTVWVMRDGKLEIRKAVIEFRDPQFAYVKEGLEDGDEIVTTTLATVADGVLLRKIDEESAEEDSTAVASEAENSVE